MVQSSTGRPAGWSRMFVREVVGGSLLTNLTCGITYLVSCVLVAASAERRAVWDRVAGTEVVRAR